MVAGLERGLGMLLLDAAISERFCLDSIARCRESLDASLHGRRQTDPGSQP